MKTLFILIQYILPQHALSRLTGLLASCEITWLKNLLISQFIKAYAVDMSQAEKERAEDYKNFNEFFTRPLKADQRPICAEREIACPADGTISEIGSIHRGQLLQAKHKYYSTASLLASATDAALFTGGNFATIYLSPKDYHRVHMPISGKLIKTRYVPGNLFSVNQTTADHVDNVFARNERLICLFETEIGPMAVVLVGAMIVAGISTTWQEIYQTKPFTVVETLFDNNPVDIAKGEEIGRFYLGSTAIVLLPKSKTQWDAELKNGSATRMGQAIGSFI